MFEVYSVPLSTLVKEFELEVAYKASDYDVIQLAVADVARPGLQLAGYFDHFEPMRLQVMGNVEISYLQKLSDTERRMTLDRYYAYKFPALLVTRYNPLDPVCMELAEKHDITILRCREATSTVVSAIIAYLSAALAPRITRHGVFMELFGDGVLIMGDSGVGKSETAIELVKRGHRLIADDAVEIRRVSDKSLVGTAPDNIRHFIELRGIGIINASRIFGVGAVKLTEKIDLVINMEPWDVNKAYDRMGLDNQTTEILDLKIPSLTIPVKPGRNLAVIIEVAAMNSRQKKLGYNAAEDLLKRLGMTDDEEIEVPKTKPVTPF